MPLLLDALYLLGLLVLSPWLLFRAFRTGRYRHALRDRLFGLERARRGLAAKQFGARPVWFHGVSVGEIHLLRQVVARFRRRWPDINFNVNSGSPDTLMRDVKQGDLDVALAVTESEAPIEPRHAWRREAVWVRSDATRLDPQRPVPLVSYAEDCACQRVTIAALREAGRRFELVFTARSLAGLAAAVEAGFGVMVVPRGRAINAALRIWDDAPLPKLPELYCGVFVREGGNREAVDEFAEQLAELRVLPDQPGSADPIVPILALQGR